MEEKLWKLEDARLVARVVMQWLGDACERIEVAGSVRREKGAVHDIELVYIPKMVTAQATLFGGALQVPATEERLLALVRDQKLMWDEVTRRHGEKYQRLIHVNSGMVVELFRAEARNWGAIMAIRTGPEDYIKMVVSHSWQNGVMPVEMVQRDGYLWDRGVIVPCATELDYFTAIGIPWWPPAERHPERLSLWAQSNAKVAVFE